MAMTLITTNTLSSSANSAFTSGIDSTYKLYIFKFLNIHPASQDPYFQFQVNASGQSGYNESMTTSFFKARHNEGDGTNDLLYTDSDQAQGTAYQPLSHGVNNANDESCSGELFLFNPSNTTYVKHFYSRTASIQDTPLFNDVFVSGYINVTAAITNINFQMSSGNMDSGTIKMYGVG